MWKLLLELFLQFLRHNSFIVGGPTFSVINLFSCLISGLPSNGCTTWTSIPPRKTFCSRIVVLLSGWGFFNVSTFIYQLLICIHSITMCCFQPMMGSLHALSIVVEKASSNNFSGSAMLNLLQSQVNILFCSLSLRLSICCFGDYTMEYPHCYKIPSLLLFMICIVLNVFFFCFFFFFFFF